MSTLTEAFEPRWASAPGDSIRSILDRRGWTVKDLADRLGIGDPATRRLIVGESAITAEVADSLAGVLGGSPRFWLARETQYRESTKWLSADALTKAMPTAQMIQLGWVEKSDSWRTQAEQSLAFFDASDPEEAARRVRAILDGVRYRASESFTSDEVTLAVWLRRAEIEAAELDVQDWSPATLREQLAAIRVLTREPNPSIFLPALQTIGARAGVAFVLVRSPKGAALSGAALRGNDGRRIIALTARHLSDDHFWFTVFHEMGHLLLHDAEETFIDDFGADGDSEGRSAVESEADRFAHESLVPGGVSALDTGAVRGPSKRDVLRFASKLGVAPGVIVGQLQHAGTLRYNQLNGLKRRYSWSGANLRI